MEIQTVCRLCLCENGNLIYIFECRGSQGWTAADGIREFLQMQVSGDDLYPQCVCSECIEKLEDFKSFKEQCESTKEFLDRACTGTRDIKREKKLGKQVLYCEDERDVGSGDEDLDETPEKDPLDVSEEEELIKSGVKGHIVALSGDVLPSDNVYIPVSCVGDDSLGQTSAEAESESESSNMSNEDMSEECKNASNTSSSWHIKEEFMDMSEEVDLSEFLQRKTTPTSRRSVSIPSNGAMATDKGTLLAGASPNADKPSKLDARRLQTVQKVLNNSSGCPKGFKNFTVSGKDIKLLARPKMAPYTQDDKMIGCNRDVIDTECSSSTITKKGSATEDSGVLKAKISPIWTEKFIEGILRRKEDGESCRRIARSLRIAESTLRRRLKVWRDSNPGRWKPADEDAQDVEGQETKLVFRSVGNLKRNCRSGLSLREWEEVRRRRMNGESGRAIAYAMGIPESTLRKKLREAGISLRRSNVVIQESPSVVMSKSKVLLFCARQHALVPNEATMDGE